MSTTNSHTGSQTPETEIRPDVPNDDPDLATPVTTQEIIDETLEVLQGEGEPITERAPIVPFLVVFLSYFFVMASLMAVVAFCLWLFVLRE